MQRHSFAAMGTEVEILLEADAGAEALLALASAEEEFERLEALLSRFRPDSELSRLNAQGELDAGDELLAVVRLALAARERTGGRFDPTVHDALVAAGYDRSFELLEDAGSSRPPGGRGPARCGGRVAVRGRRLVLGPGARLDLGGIGKGYAVDRVAARLAPVGACLVNAGGDLAVAGAPDGGVWPVAVELPQGSLTLGLAGGALATSGSDRRRWRAEGEERHHLVDPRAGRPSRSDLRTVTVAAATAVEAEVWAKALFLAGEEAAAAEAEALGLPALLVTADGRLRRAGGLA
ncbi:MAG TPA: FAD:protein FMN transferase [Gaiellaceae bacterium]|nr:FAD:protein FMN transferase [Gaiellaceae bacterium]